MLIKGVQGFAGSDSARGKAAPDDDMLKANIRGFLDKKTATTCGRCEGQAHYPHHGVESRGIRWTELSCSWRRGGAFFCLVETREQGLVVASKAGQ